MDEKVVDAAKGAAALIAIAFAVFFFLDDRHAHHRDIEGADAELRERIMMSDSTRYAEIIKYYYELRLERPLTKAEQARLELAERQQERIGETLKK